MKTLIVKIALSVFVLSLIAVASARPFDGPTPPPQCQPSDPHCTEPLR